MYTTFKAAGEAARDASKMTGHAHTVKAVEGGFVVALHSSLVKVEGKDGSVVVAKAHINRKSQVLAGRQRELQGSTAADRTGSWDRVLVDVSPKGDVKLKLGEVEAENDAVARSWATEESLDGYDNVIDAADRQIVETGKRIKVRRYKGFAPDQRQAAMDLARHRRGSMKTEWKHSSPYYSYHTVTWTEWKIVYPED